MARVGDQRYIAFVPIGPPCPAGKSTCDETVLGEKPPLIGEHVKCAWGASCALGVFSFPAVSPEAVTERRIVRIAVKIVFISPASLAASGGPQTINRHA